MVVKHLVAELVSGRFGTYSISDKIMLQDIVNQYMDNSESAL